MSARRPQTALLLVFITLALASLCIAQRVDLGDWSIGSEVTLISHYIKTEIIVETDASVAGPTLTVSAFGPFPVSVVHRGLVSASGTTVEIRDWSNQETGSMGSGAKLVPNPVGALLPLLVVAALMTSLQRRNGARSGSLVVLLAILLSVAMIAQTQAGWQAEKAEPYVLLRVRIPAGSSMGSISLDLKDGSVVASGSTVSVSNLAIDYCTSGYEGSASFVNIDAVVVTSSLTICAPESVSVTNLLQSGSQVAVSLTSTNGSVHLSSPYFTGSYQMTLNEGTSGALSQTGPACSVDAGASATHRSGSCGTSGSSHTLSITAAVSASLDIPAGCPLGFTGDGPMPANVPASPAVTPATTWVNTYTDPTAWEGFISWGSSPNINATYGPDNTILLEVAQWVPDAAWLHLRTNLFMRAGVAYPFKVSLTPGPNAPTFVNASVILLNRWPSGIWGLQPGDFNDTNPYVLDSHHWNAPFSGTTQVNLVSPIDIGSARILIRVTFPQHNKKWNMKVGVLELTSPIPTPAVFHDGTEGLIVQEKMSATLDSNPGGASNCPHLSLSGIKHWHDPSTWPGGFMPNPAETISIPEGERVLISSCSLLPTNFVYERIHVPATSQLIFSDADINMRVRNIHVDGQLHMGGPLCRLNGKINIEFVGSKTHDDDIAPTMGSKGIGVGREGSIDIHGRQFNPTWTRLRATVWPGADTIYVQDTNNWEVGQTIVIATSAYKDLLVDQNEVRQIVAIDQSGTRIQLDSPLLNYHYSGTEHQVEVGLLSRRIVLQGDERSYDESFGGHTRVTGEGRFSGVQTYRMGQTNMLGKYPFHFHVMGPSPESYVRDCSIWNSFFRCIAIHGTNESQALRNVVFNATAHCYYLEDGVEEHNVLNYNLAVKINTIGTPMTGESQTGEVRYSSDDLILPADGAAAGFYITNAYNTFIGNAASGGWAGFSFPNLPKPIGMSRSSSMKPEQRPTYIFRSNTAHSSGYSFPGGGCIYVGGLLQYVDDSSDVLYYDDGRHSRRTVDATNHEAWMQFNDTKVWMCGMGVSHWGDRIEIVGFESHDSGRSVQVFGEAWFSEALVNAESGALTKYPNTPIGFQFYDTRVKSIVTQVTFRGFTANSPPYDPESDTNPYLWADRRAFISLIHSDYFKPQGISAVDRISFENCDASQFVGHKRLDTGSARYFNFVDWNGDMSGTPGVPQIIGSGSGWWRYRDDCVLNSDWKSYRCPQGTRKIVNLDYRIPNVIVANVADNDEHIGTTYLFGPGIPSGRGTTLTRNPGITGVGQIGWYFHTNQGTPATFSVYQYLVPTGQWVMGAWKYPAGSEFTIQIKMDWGRPTVDVTPADSLADVYNGDGTLYYFDDSHLYIKMINNQPDYSNLGYTRDGVTIWDIMQAVHYDVSATCSGGSNGWCPGPYTHPSGTW